DWEHGLFELEQSLSKRFSIESDRKENEHAAGAERAKGNVKKLDEIIQKLEFKLCQDVLDGRLTLPKNSLAKDDRLIHLFSLAFKHKKLSNAQRMNAARVWFPTEDAYYDDRNFKENVNLLKELAVSSNDPGIKSEAIQLMTDCLKA